MKAAKKRSGVYRKPAKACRQMYSMLKPFMTQYDAKILKIRSGGEIMAK